jgi:hypothetical protein
MNIKKYICAIDYILLQLDLIASKKGLLNKGKTLPKFILKRDQFCE